MNFSEGFLTKITMAAALSLALVLSAGVPAVALASDGSQEVADTQTEELEITRNDSFSSAKPGSGSSASSTPSSKGSSASAATTGTSASRTTTASTGDASVNALPAIAAAAALVGAGAVLRRSLREQ